jgi:hypothetical protein
VKPEGKSPKSSELNRSLPDMRVSGLCAGAVPVEAVPVEVDWHGSAQLTLTLVNQLLE